MGLAGVVLAGVAVRVGEVLSERVRPDESGTPAGAKEPARLLGLAERSGAVGLRASCV